MNLVEEVNSLQMQKLLSDSSNIHYNHYGEKRLPFASISAKGNRMNLIEIDNQENPKMIEVIDASGGYASACLGSACNRIKEAITEGIDSVGYVTDELASLERSRLLYDLFGENGIWANSFPAEKYHISGRNSGSEGIELALKFVLESRIDKRSMRIREDKQSKNIILAFEGAWHGWTNGLVSLLNRRYYTTELPLLLQKKENDINSIEVIHIPFGDFDCINAFFEEKGANILAIFIEPIQGDAGIILPPDGYLRHVRDLCQKYQALLVADEVLTFAKTGRFFAMSDQKGHISTDITVIGKSLGMGVISTSMVIAKKELVIRNCGAVSTSDLRPLTCHIIREGIKYIIEEGFLQKSAKLGEELRELIDREVVQKYPDLYLEVRGYGYMNGIEVKDKVSNYMTEFRKCLIQNGLYVELMAGAGKRSNGLRYIFPTIRIAPPLITTKEDIKEIVYKLNVGTQKFIKEYGIL